MSQSMKLVDILARELKQWPDSFSYIEWDHARNCAVAIGRSQFTCIKNQSGRTPSDYLRAGVTHEQWQAAVDALNGPVWPDKGALPPVGVVCEVFDCNHEYNRKFNGQSVEIVAHHTGLAVFSADGGEYHGLVASKFRPIRTAEQIAADERDKEVASAMSDMPRSVMTSSEVVRWMISNGYRKQADQ